MSVNLRKCSLCSSSCLGKYALWADMTDCFSPRQCLEIHEKHFTVRLHSLSDTQKKSLDSWVLQKIPSSFWERVEVKGTPTTGQRCRWQYPSDSVVWALGLSWAACFLLETYTDQSSLHQLCSTMGPGAIPTSGHSSAILSSSSVHIWEKSNSR